MSTTTTHRRHSGLFWVIFFSSMACMLIPLIIVSIISIKSLSGNLSTTANNNLQQLAVEKMNEVNFVLQNQVQVTKSVAQSDYVCREVADGSDSQGMINYLVKVFNNAGTLYENFFITRGSAGFADGLGGVTLHDVAGEPWYEICKTKGEFLGNNVSPVTGRPVYVISYGLYHNGKFIGGLNNSIDTGNMTKDITGSISDGVTSVLIIDSEGNVIASENEDQILKVNFNTENDSTAATMQQMLKAGSGLCQFQFNGTQNLGAFASEGGMFTLVFMPLSSYQQKISSVIMSIGVIAFICMGIAIVLIFIISMSITRPIKVVNQSMHDIAQGEADLTKRITINAKYEIRDLLDNFNTFTEKMQTIVADIKDSTGDLTKAGRKLETSTFDTESSITEILANIDSVNNRIHHQNTIVDEAAAAMNDILSNLQQLEGQITTQSHGVTSASDEVEGMLNNITAVNKSIEDMVLNFGTLQTNLHEGTTHQKQVADLVKQIENQSRSLEEANVVIANIASQTNLLAMNAAIEAAHAGNAGQGFSVVAGEIRKLSENSNQQSKKISDMISGIKESIASIVVATEQAQYSFNGISDNVNRTSGNVESIQVSMERQQQGSRQISSVLKSITESTSQVLEDSSKITSETKTISTEINKLQDSAAEMEQSTAEMKIGARKINQTGIELTDITRQVKESISRNSSEVGKFVV